jgi:chromosome partitioning protein
MRKLNPMARIIAISNQKGGVGKTTTAVNLAACLAETGQTVLLVDLDPQGNASSGAGVDKQTLQRTMYDVLCRNLPLADALTPGAVPNLAVAPANTELVGAELELAPTLAREHRLADALKDVQDSFDYIIIDCPPSLGLLTLNALTAAHTVLIPLQTEYYALEGLGQLTQTIGLIQRRLNPSLGYEGVLLTLYDGRNRLCREVAGDVRSYFGSKVFDTPIPRNVRLGESPSFGLPIIQYDPTCSGAMAYRELAREMLARHNPRQSRHTRTA